MISIIAELVGDFEAFLEEGDDTALALGDVAINRKLAIVAEVVDRM
jgi:hypothetical protein